MTSLSWRFWIFWSNAFVKLIYLKKTVLLKSMTRTWSKAPIMNFLAKTYANSGKLANKSFCRAFFTSPRLKWVAAASSGSLYSNLRIASMSVNRFNSSWSGPSSKSETGAKASGFCTLTLRWRSVILFYGKPPAIWMNLTVFAAFVYLLFSKVSAAAS